MGYGDTGRFSKLPYLGMNLSHWPKLQNVVPFYPTGSKLSLFLLYGQRFPRYGPIFKIVILGHDSWPLAKVSEVAHIHVLSFYHRESKLSLFWHYGPRLRRYRLIFKIAIFGPETWPLAKVPEVAHTLFLPQGFEIALIFFCSTGSGFRATGRFSKLPYLGMKLGHWPKCQKLPI